MERLWRDYEGVCSSHDELCVKRAADIALETKLNNPPDEYKT